LFRQAIALTESIPKIRNVVSIRGLGSQRASQNGPIHHGAVRDDALHTRIERGKDGSGSAEAAADDENGIRLDVEHFAQSRFANRALQTADHVENVFMRRASKKLTATLPGATIAGIEHPIAFACEPIREWLLPRYTGHAIAQDDHPLSLTRT